MNVINIHWGFVLAFLLSVVPFSWANDEEAEEWDPVSAGPATTWTAPLCKKGELVVQPYFYYNHTRGSFDNEGDYNALSEGDEKSQFQESLFWQLGLTDRLELDGQVFYNQNFAETSGARADDAGIGESYGFLRYCLLEEKGPRPNITGLFQLKIPTGKFQKADPEELETDVMGDGAWEHGYGLTLTKKMKPFLLHLDGILSFPQPRKVDGVKTRYGNNLTLDAGMEYFLPKGFNLLFEFNHFIQSDKRQAGALVPASDESYSAIGPGIGWSNDKIQWLLSYQRTIMGTNTDANDSAILTFVYTFP